MNLQPSYRPHKSPNQFVARIVSFQLQQKPEPLLPDNPPIQGSLPRSALSHQNSFLSYCLSETTVGSELNFCKNYRSFTVAALNFIYRGRRKQALRLHPTAQVRGLNRKRNPSLTKGNLVRLSNAGSTAMYRDYYRP